MINNTQPNNIIVMFARQINAAIIIIIINIIYIYNIHITHHLMRFRVHFYVYARH